MKKNNPSRRMTISVAIAVLLVALCVVTALTRCGTGEDYSPSVYGTAFSRVPPLVAIALALITKEVYSSLCIGIVAGGLLYANFNIEGTLTHVLVDDPTLGYGISIETMLAGALPAPGSAGLTSK